MRNRANRFLSILIWDFTLQATYYFWVAAAVVTLVWLLLLGAIAGDSRAFWIPLLIFGDITNIVLLFIAGILFMERSQGTITVSAVMPVSTNSWLFSKLFSLTVLCTFCGVVLVLFSGNSVDWIRMLPAIILSSALFTSIGFLLACPFQKILNYFCAMALALAVLNIPIFSYLEIFELSLMWLLPSQAALHVLVGGYQDMSLSSYYGALLLLLGWITLFHLLGVKALDHYNSQS